jgi:hypothetical protein
MYASGLANRVLREYLGHSQPLPVWYHYSVLQGMRRSFKVLFDVNGYKLRPWLNHPKYEPVDPAILSRLLP